MEVIIPESDASLKSAKLQQLAVSLLCMLRQQLQGCSTLLSPVSYA